MAAYFSTTFANFAAVSTAEIVGKLSDAAAKAHTASQFYSQTHAWDEQIEILRALCKFCLGKYPESAHWGLLIEYPIPRRQKRIDVVVLAGQIIFVLEFKTSDQKGTAEDRRQVEDYALDLRDFHEESHGKMIVPMLVASKGGENKIATEIDLTNPVQRVRSCTPDQLPQMFSEALEILPPSNTQLAIKKWSQSGYRPVPTIIEAAEHLFANHSVSEITSYHADFDGIQKATTALIDAITKAQREREKCVCFVTGVPGAGKTLVGLTVAHDPKTRASDRPAAVFLSGNGPLVRIVSEALVRDHVRREKVTKKQAKRKVGTFIQNVHSFIRHYADNATIPPDKVVIFDEAQRAWSEKKLTKALKKKSGRAPSPVSEPELMLSIMDRQPDWSVLVALVGGGQEIHDGEAGLKQWGDALSKKYRHWKVFVSPEVLHGGPSVAGQKLFNGRIPAGIKIRRESGLHLPVSVRTFKAENVSRWLSAVLEGRSDEARSLSKQFGDFPIVLVRDLNDAKTWLRSKARGSERFGLVASSNSIRLRAEGIELSSGFRRGYQYEEWFLAKPEDVRSSFQLEVAASEFECQGLELDWVGVCWGGDFLFDATKGQWKLQRFEGSGWTKPRQAEVDYLPNKYRVLLSRARKGLVIWVPRGSSSDRTREPALLDSTARFLLACGVKPFNHS
jgi:hypothetical protein